MNGYLMFLKGLSEYQQRAEIGALVTLENYLTPACQVSSSWI